MGVRVPARIVGTLTWVAMAAGLGGCPGQLDDPEQYRQALAPSCELDMEVPELLAARCTGSGCHGAESPGAGLDLVSDDLASRLVDVPATQCDGYVRVSSEDPASSYFVAKLEGTAPAGCGTRMPATGDALTEEEMQCVRLWLQQLGTSRGDAGAPRGDAGMPPDDAGATAGDGGS